MASELKQSENNEETVASLNIATSDTSAMVKAAFYAWISDGHFKEGTPENIIASWDKASEQLLRR
ncbi:MAG: hypothetical protein LBQ58_03105, partial [Synergistaceae bacterium]|nr:hypothetical protein [Synergistaceae bacterium]